MQSFSFKKDERLYTTMVSDAEKSVISRMHDCCPGHRFDTWTIQKYGSRFKITYFKTDGNTKACNSEVVLQSDKERFEQSISRTKSLINEIALCNEFTLFCTFTIADDKRDRFDLRSYSRDFAMFIRNFNRNRSVENKVKYLCIPERHKNGAWHMHGLLKGLSVDDFVVNEFGYYDWVDYSKRFGFFSCSPVKSRDKCANYITKYISKDVAKNVRDSHGHFFYASQGLKRREVLRRGVVKLPDDLPFDFENDYVKVLWIDDENFVENLIDNDKLFCGDIRSQKFL